MARGLQKPEVRARSAKPARDLVVRIAIVVAAPLVLAAGGRCVLASLEQLVRARMIRARESDRTGADARQRDPVDTARSGRQTVTNAFILGTFKGKLNDWDGDGHIDLNSRDVYSRVDGEIDSDMDGSPDYRPAAATTARCRSRGIADRICTGGESYGKHRNAGRPAVRVRPNG